MKAGMQGASPNPKYYYDCPLKAAYMAKHHGMAIQITYPGGALRDVHKSEFLSVKPKDWMADRFFIHPESLHLLEPQVGDMISHLGTRAWKIDGVEEKIYTHRAFGAEKVDRFTFRSDGPMIIQRNGQPFLWPESEAA